MLRDLVLVVVLVAVGCVVGMRLFGGGDVVVEGERVMTDTLRYENLEPVAVDSLYRYADSVGRWSAEIEGRDVRLKSLVIVDRELERDLLRVERPRWDLSARAGTFDTEMWYGVGVERSSGAWVVGVDVGCDVGGDPHVGFRVGYSLWRSRR